MSTKRGRPKGSPGKDRNYNQALQNNGVMERIESIRFKYHLSKAKLLGLCGTNPRSASINPYPGTILLWLFDVGFSIDWLLSGAGQMFRSEELAREVVVKLTELNKSFVTQVRKKCQALNRRTATLTAQIANHTAALADTEYDTAAKEYHTAAIIYLKHQCAERLARNKQWLAYAEAYHIQDHISYDAVCVK